MCVCVRVCGDGTASITRLHAKHKFIVALATCTVLHARFMRYLTYTSTRHNKVGTISS